MNPFRGGGLRVLAVLVAGGLLPACAEHTNDPLPGGSAGYQVGAISGNTTEGGGTATFTVALGAAPTADVTVHFDSSQPLEGTVGATSLLFTTATWSTPQIVTVTGQDDLVQDGNKGYSIVFTGSTSADLAYAGTIPAPNVAVTNTDDDTAGYTVSAISGPTTEGGGTATFSVRLTSQPVADVTVRFDSNRPLEGTVGVTSLLFTSLDWMTPQVVTVTGQDDLAQDGSQDYEIAFTGSTSVDPAYAGTTPASNVEVANADDDTAGYTVSAISGPTTEGGGTATFTVVLNAQPLADVTVSFDTNDPLEGTVSTTSLVFTSVNWSTVRTVTVTGQNDAAKDGDQGYSIVFAATASLDLNYGGSTPGPNVAVMNWDNDTPGFRVVPIGGLTTTEAGMSASFTVALRSPPGADVTLGVSSSRPDEGSPSPAFLTFGSADWFVPIKVTVTGQDDPADDGNQAYVIELAPDLLTLDLDYLALDPPDVTAVNVDDD
jgi:hypothetical protein